MRSATGKGREKEKTNSAILNRDLYPSKSIEHLYLVLDISLLQRRIRIHSRVQYYPCRPTV